KSGFSIVGTLKRDTRRYSFNRHPNVIDLGLRLAEVEANNLEPEDVSYGNSDPARNLRENRATQEEIEFLRSQWVELNAFPSDLLVKWIEEKLEQQGLQKLVPDDVVLEQAYRRAVAIKCVKEKLGALNEEAGKIGKDATIPQGLRALVMEELGKDRAIPWDEALYKVCAWKSRAAGAAE
ncbi:MAG TPA: hypothetical protein VE735_08680, partial [Gammaproteobacteria bacterium]|nr:hypothetical protein [Gammaproteobacteria bacterium]